MQPPPNLRDSFSLVRSFQNPKSLPLENRLSRHSTLWSLLPNVPHLKLENSGDFILPEPSKGIGMLFLSPKPLLLAFFCFHTLFLHKSHHLF